MRYGRKSVYRYEVLQVASVITASGPCMADKYGDGSISSLRVVISSWSICGI